MAEEKDYMEKDDGAERAKLAEKDRKRLHGKMRVRRFKAPETRLESLSSFVDTGDDRE
jgi:hypothetical protein